METSVGDSRVQQSSIVQGEASSSGVASGSDCCWCITALLIPSDSYVGEDQLDWAILAVSGARSLTSYPGRCRRSARRRVTWSGRPAPHFHLARARPRSDILRRRAPRQRTLAGNRRCSAGVGEGDLVQKQANLQSELDQLRATQEERRPTVERILENKWRASFVNSASQLPARCSLRSASNSPKALTS